jgi:LAO/AO transport system kinase
VTKADLGQVAISARRDLHAAPRSLGARDTAVVAVSSIAPPQGIDDLLDAIDAHRAVTDAAAHRLRARRLHALADFTAEHGHRGLRALGGRRAAERWLEQQDAGLDVPALERALTEHAGAA